MPGRLIKIAGCEERFKLVFVDRQPNDITKRQRRQLEQVGCMTQ